MMYDFEPFSRLGELKKNLTREEVRNIFFNSYKSFYKTKKCTTQTDNFFNENLHVYYSDDLIIEGVEVFLPNTVNFNGVNILNEKFTEVVEMLSKVDGTVQVDGYGADFDALGLSIYCPDHEDNQEAKTEAVYVTF